MSLDGRNRTIVGIESLARATGDLLSGPISRDTGYYRCDTPYRAILFKGGWRSPKMVRYPPWYLVSQRHICAIPHFATYRAIIVRYPIKKQAQNDFAILSLQVSRDMKSIAVGPLRRFESLAFVGGHVSTPKTQNLVLVDPALVAMRLGSRNWRLLMMCSFSVDCEMACES